MNPKEIRALRKKTGLSQREFAKKIGVSQKTVWFWESGKSKPNAECQKRLETLSVNSEGEVVNSDEEVVNPEEDVVKKVVKSEGDVVNLERDVVNSEEKVVKEVVNSEKVVKKEDTVSKKENVSKNSKNDTNVVSEKAIRPPSKYDPPYIVSVLELLGHREAGGVTEVRIFPQDRYMTINGRKEFVGATVSGYYDNYEKLVDDITPFDGKANIYVTINPVMKDLLARANNRLRYSATTTTSDDDILCDLWFVYDCDPNRPADISATEAELQAAISKRGEIASFLSQWASSLRGMSGNGGHGLIRLRGESGCTGICGEAVNPSAFTGYPNTKETRKAKERLTQFLHDKFTDWELDAQGNPILDEKGNKIKRKDGVSVDNTVFNMSRIWKLYGTMAVKGDNVKDRPHRRSFLEIPDVIPEPVDLYAHINEIIPQGRRHTQEPTPESNSRKKERARDDDYPLLDVKAYLNASGVTWRTKEKDNETWYQWDLQA